MRARHPVWLGSGIVLASLGIATGIWAARLEGAGPFTLCLAGIALAYIGAVAALGFAPGRHRVLGAVILCMTGAMLLMNIWAAQLEGLGSLTSWLTGIWLLLIAGVFAVSMWQNPGSWINGAKGPTSVAR